MFLKHGSSRRSFITKFQSIKKLAAHFITQVNRAPKTVCYLAKVEGKGSQARGNLWKDSHTPLQSRRSEEGILNEGREKKRC
jgi:hypothetical protein